MRGTEHSYETQQSTLHLCFQQASASHRHKSCCTSGHVPLSPVVPTVAFVALPYLSLVCNRLDTLGSLATNGCRNSSPHTGRSGSPQSLPCTHSGRSPGTAGSENPQDHSHRLRGSYTSVRLEKRQKYPKTHGVRAYPQYPKMSARAQTHSWSPAPNQGTSTQCRALCLAGCNIHCMYSQCCNYLSHKALQFFTPFRCNQLQLIFLLFTGRDIKEESLDHPGFQPCLQDLLLLKTESVYSGHLQSSCAERFNIRKQDCCRTRFRECICT